MYQYRTKGGLKKGMAVTLAACFLMGSSITSLAAGDGVTEVYNELAKYTSVKDPIGAEEEGVFPGDISDEEAVQQLAQALGIDPDKIVMTDANLDIMPYLGSGPIHITWYVPKDTVYMSLGYSAEIGEKDHIYVYGDPNDLEFEMGIKDPEAHMWYAEGSGLVDAVFTVKIKGRHYFYVYNKSEDTELHIESYTFRKSKEELEAEKGGDDDGDDEGDDGDDEGDDDGGGHGGGGAGRDQAETTE